MGYIYKATHPHSAPISPHWWSHLQMQVCKLQRLSYVKLCTMEMQHRVPCKAEQSTGWLRLTITNRLKAKYVHSNVEGLTEQCPFTQTFCGHNWTVHEWTEMLNCERLAKHTRISGSAVLQILQHNWKMCRTTARWMPYNSNAVQCCISHKMRHIKL
jgi:hypothetical protein